MIGVDTQITTTPDAYKPQNSNADIKLNITNKITLDRTKVHNDTDELYLA